jgi:sugar phosphate permease
LTAIPSRPRANRPRANRPRANRPKANRPKANRLHYAWIIAAVTFVVVLLTAGVRAAPGVLIVPLEAEFHWSRATISFAVGVNLLVYGMIGPFAAALMDRFGVRRTMTLALAATASGVALSPAINQPWQLVLLWGFVVGIGCGFIGAYLAAFIAARWFKERRGIVIGVLTAGNAAGQLVFLPAMAALVTYAGWRVMTLSLASILMVFVPLVALLMRDRPEDLGLAAYGATRVSGPPPRPGNPIAFAFRALGEGAGSRDFWLIAGGYFVCGASTNGLIGTHLIPACVDHGLTEVVGAGLLATTGVFAFIGGTLSGWLSDRWDNRFLLFWYYGLRGLSLMYLPFAFDMSFYGLSLFSMFYGLDWIASVPPTVRLLTRTVGVERVGIMVAWITVIHQVGGASAAYLGGVLRIAFGTYLEAFMLSGLMCIGAALMVLFISADGPERQSSVVPLPAG